MTKKSATERLREMLDERGVEWLNSDGDCCDSDDDYMLAEQDSRKTTWSVDIAGDDMTITAHEVYENDELKPWFDLEFHEYFTPEQAIAATLGEEKAGKKSPPEGGPGPCGQPSDDIIHDAATLGGGTLTANDVLNAFYRHGARWQTIADELNATLGGEECKLVYGENDHGDDGWWCQSCGEWFAASFRHTGRNNIIYPRYCQHCGKVVGE